MSPRKKVDRRRRAPEKTQRVNLDIPLSFLAEIDAEANRIGIPRQAFIKTALAEAMRRLEDRPPSRRR